MIPSIATKFQYVNSTFIFFFTHYMFRPLLAIFRWDIQLDIFKVYLYYNRSVARTQLDVEMLYALYRYFDPWSPIHVIKLSTNIKIIKILRENRSHIQSAATSFLFPSDRSVLKKKLACHTCIKCKNFKMSRRVDVCISSWFSGRSSKFCGLLVHQRRVDWAVGSGGFLSYIH
jgi:hypothetical protein